MAENKLNDGINELAFELLRMARAVREGAADAVTYMHGGRPEAANKNGGEGQPNLASTLRQAIGLLNEAQSDIAAVVTSVNMNTEPGGEARGQLGRAAR
jgi:hypothetical protein